MLIIIQQINFQSWSKSFVYLVPLWKNGWTLYNLDANKIFVSLDVKFVEEQFAFLTFLLLQVLLLFSPNFSSTEPLEICQFHPKSYYTTFLLGLIY